MLLGSYLIEVALNGAETFEPLWALFPISYAAWRLSRVETAVTVAAAIVATGPLLPADVVAQQPQGIEEWLSRGVFFALLGIFLVLVFTRLRKSLAMVEAESSVALRRAERDAAARALRHAVMAGELVLHYQPIVRAADGEIAAVEALVRWDDPERGLIAPGDFLPLAEESGVIRDIDLWVCRQACADALQWQAIQPARVAVNLSSRTLADRGAMAVIATAIEASGLPPHLLEIEMTETATADDGTEALASLTWLGAFGCRLSLDDFGMGYAVLQRLRAFPFTTIKIDRSYISGVAGPDRAVIEAIHGMAHSLNLEVLAEGVEDASQLVALRAMGCDLVQGYFLSRPLPLADLHALLEARSGLRGEPVDEIGPVLDEVVRLTGLTNAYLTRIHWDTGEQEILRSRAAGQVIVPEGLRVAWSDTLCRRIMEGAPALTADAAATYGTDNPAVSLAGVQSYVSVPVRRGGETVGTLCGASCERVELPPETLEILQGFADGLAIQIPAPVAAAGTIGLRPRVA